SDVWFAQGIADGAFADYPAESSAGKTTADVLAIYAQMPAILDKIKGVSGAQLATPISFFGGVFNFPGVMYLQFLNNHMIHHRGQLSTYVRAANGKVPSIYGGSADEPFEMPATAGS
ncbi:MAG: DinB family protein, partial [Bryobacteraceae bacterium]